ncbi:hypothetical protein HF1_03850 [Mycoplasma haemofelis str. Langford 1]|uniref:Uncharacterized protein n=1 Tax=Mycoplasma haemofelis (strain Langford 1) TaxID=941640 RepID=E8ZGX2_MYCHL|nr:hypothetical protein [Mycoplasma haemofelis]CBY92393.1 hypothetical protein HF1_03850 [Mycoplasma haemofelis str. Langford 1]
MNTLVRNAALGFSASTAVSAGATKLVLPREKESKSISKWIGDRFPEKRLLIRGWGKKQDGSPEEWKVAWKNYLNAYSGAESNPFSLTLTLTDSSGNAPSEFIDACKKRFSVQVSDIEDERLVHVLEYCTRSTSVEDLILSTSKRLLSSSDSSGWNELWNAYKKDNADKESGKDEWGIFTSKGGTNDTNATQNFKNKCNSEKLVKTGSKTHRSFINVFKYCSK